MKTTSKLLIVVFTCLALAASAYAQSPREELKQMVEQLQKTPTDNALREKIINLAPAVPEEAERPFVMAGAYQKEAKKPTDSATKEAKRELTGTDGAPMVLVPAGEFLYGDNNQRLALPVFYMDKYEVTTKLYAVFLQATSRKQPDYWNEVSQVSDGDRPVIGVDWNDADAYCRQYGKRLPTGQEWEKAARGTDGRKYPWGNEEPTSRHAKYDQDGKASWNGYATLASVESYEAGKSPYGLYHMAGNVWEWTSSDYDSSGKRKVIGGGSWYFNAGNLRSAYRFYFYPTSRNSYLGFRCAKTP